MVYYCDFVSLEDTILRWQRGGDKLYDDCQPVLVPVADLWPYREYTRSRPDARRSPREWDELKASMRRGWKRGSHIVFLVSRTEGAMVGEGNHRLAIARELGIPEVPVRFDFRHEEMSMPRWNPGKLKLFESMNLPEGFEGFDAVHEEYQEPVTLAAWRSLKRGDSFSLGGRQRWVVVRAIDTLSLWVIKPAQVGKRRRKDFVAHLLDHNAERIEVREGAGGDLHLVGPRLDEGALADIVPEEYARRL